MEYDKIDLALSSDGDFVVDESGDLALSKGFDCTRDDIALAVKTQKNDSDVYPEFGADLEELIGYPNSREIGEEGAARIVDVLVSNGLVNSEDLTVIPLPAGDEIKYYVVIQRENGEQEVVHYPLKLSGFGG